MQLDKPQYLALLNDARNLHILDWEQPEPHVYTMQIGSLTLKVIRNPTRSNWQILHERSGVLTRGSSESATIAQVEMIKYAEHWVRHGMVGVLA